MTRLNKEYRVLGSSLPGMSLVAQDLNGILTPPQIQYWFEPLKTDQTCCAALLLDQVIHHTKMHLL
jgi:hypothetical protein